MTGDRLADCSANQMTWWLAGDRPARPAPLGSARLTQVLADLRNAPPAPARPSLVTSSPAPRRPPPRLQPSGTCLALPAAARPPRLAPGPGPGRGRVRSAGPRAREGEARLAAPGRGGCAFASGARPGSARGGTGGRGLCCATATAPRSARGTGTGHVGLRGARAPSVTWARGPPEKDTCFPTSHPKLKLVPLHPAPLRGQGHIGTSGLF